MFDFVPVKFHNHVLTN